MVSKTDPMNMCNYCGAPCSQDVELCVRCLVYQKIEGGKEKRPTTLADIWKQHAEIWKRISDKCEERSEAYGPEDHEHGANWDVAACLAEQAQLAYEAKAAQETEG